MDGRVGNSFPVSTADLNHMMINFQLYVGAMVN